MQVFYTYVCGANNETSRHTTMSAAITQCYTALTLSQETELHISLQGDTATVKSGPKGTLDVLITPFRKAGQRTESPSKPSRLVFMGRPSASGWYKEHKQTDLGKLVGTLPKFKDVVRHAYVYIDRDWNIISTVQMPDLKPALRSAAATGSKSIDIEAVARQWVDSNAGSPPQGAVALVLLTGGAEKSNLAPRIAGKKLL